MALSELLLPGYLTLIYFIHRFVQYPPSLVVELSFFSDPQIPIVNYFVQAWSLRTPVLGYSVHYDYLVNDKNKDFNVKNVEGRTPLHFAAANGLLKYS